ncbi:MAG: penicillin acylase family protein [Flavobacteriaceae bacterium]|nr:penicillin acylase family protein [Flavobacteriaceae bacterium]
MYPGGQSGNPGSKYYDNFIDSWAEGEYLELLFYQDITEAKESSSRQTLNPVE